MNFRNKRGIIGNILALFVATIVIVLILSIFVLGASVVKKFSGNEARVNIYNEDTIGLGNMINYLDSYRNSFQVTLESSDVVLEVGDEK